MKISEWLVEMGEGNRKWRKGVPGRVKSKCKGPGAGLCFQVAEQ